VRLLEAYARGVNGFLASNGRPLPPEFQILRHRRPEPWRPADSVLFLKLMALDLGGNWRDEVGRARLARRLTPGQLADLWPDSDPADPVTYEASREAARGLDLDALAAALPTPPPGGEAALGSNVWVVGPARSATGSPLLANDPHLALTAPGPWYLAHLEAPGLAVIGATLPAVPFVVLGRNRDVAWGFTNTGSDVQDLFLEAPDPADPGRYLTPDGPAPFATRTEEILVRGAAAERLVVRETRHGPVISDVSGAAAQAAPGGRVMALAWTGLDRADRTAEAGFDVALAKDWDGFGEAFRPFATPQQNVAYADRAGRVGMLSPGHVPVRRAGDGTLPVPGETGAFDWVGRVPFEALPRAADPTRGFLLNANNRLVGADYPHLLAAAWDPPYRARRIEEVLAATPRADLAAMRALQLDVLSTRTRDLLPVLLGASVPAGGREAEVLGELRAWDGGMAPDRPEPLVFTAWLRAMGRLVWADELGSLADQFAPRGDVLAHLVTRRPAWCDDTGTAGRVESCAERSGEALAAALADLAARYGDDRGRWRWGDAHPAVLGHRPLEEVPWLRRLFSLRAPVGGDGATVNVAPAVARPLTDEPFASAHGASYRGLYDLADPDGGSRFVAATGQSGHPLSRHYRDMTELWRAGGDVPMSTRPRTTRAATGAACCCCPEPAFAAKSSSLKVGDGALTLPSRCHREERRMRSFQRSSFGARLRALRLAKGLSQGTWRASSAVTRR
jgi:penicillin amidase